MTTDSIKELVKRLRAEEWATAEREKTRNAAADALEALAGEVASLKLSNDLFQGAQKKEAEMNTQLTIQLHAIRTERDQLKAALGAIAVKAGTSECGGNYVAAISLIGDLEQMADTALEAKP